MTDAKWRGRRSPKAQEAQVLRTRAVGRALRRLAKENPTQYGRLLAEERRKVGLP